MPPLLYTSTTCIDPISGQVLVSLYKTHPPKHLNTLLMRNNKTANRIARSDAHSAQTQPNDLSSSKLSSPLPFRQPLGYQTRKVTIVIAIKVASNTYSGHSVLSKYPAFPCIYSMTRNMLLTMMSKLTAYNMHIILSHGNSLLTDAAVALFLHLR